MGNGLGGKKLSLPYTELGRCFINISLTTDQRISQKWE